MAREMEHMNRTDVKERNAKSHLGVASGKYGETRRESNPKRSK
jgi:hypothetical protein